MKYRNGYSSHWERQFTCPRSLSYWRKWALHEERYILHVLYLKKKKNSLSRHWSTADYEARTIPVTLPYMVWRVWLTEILETYTGKSETAFNLRLNNHRNHIKKGISSCELTEHFLHNKRTHNFDNNVIITIIEQIRKDNISNEQKKDLLRHREIFWQKKLNSMQPNGLNKRIG